MMNICIFYMLQIWRYLKQSIFIVGQRVHILLSKEKLFKSISLRLEELVGRGVCIFIWKTFRTFLSFSLHWIPNQGSLIWGGALFLKRPKSTVRGKAWELFHLGILSAVQIRALHAPHIPLKLTEGSREMEEDKRKKWGERGDKGSPACDMASCSQLEMSYWLYCMCECVCVPKCVCVSVCCVWGFKLAYYCPGDHMEVVCVLILKDSPQGAWVVRLGPWAASSDNQDLCLLSFTHQEAPLPG